MKYQDPSQLDLVFPQENEIPRWANLAIVSFNKTIGCVIETISVTEDSCELSGAWHFSSSSDPSVATILHNRLIITLGMPEGQFDYKRYKSLKIDIPAFIADAGESARQGVMTFNAFVQADAREYAAYMAIPPKERKLLPKLNKRNLEPLIAKNWDLSFEENNPEFTLRQLRKREEITGTPAPVKNVIAVAWLVKHLVDRWRDDEIERKGRTYMYPENISLQILPETWLSQLINLQSNTNF